jgi:hypothetical protein
MGEITEADASFSMVQNSAETVGEAPAYWPKLDRSTSNSHLTVEDDLLTFLITRDQSNSNNEQSDEEEEQSDGSADVVMYADTVYNADHGAGLTGNYFEVEILEGDCMSVRVGLTNRDDDCNNGEMPGSTNTSFAYDSDEGFRITDGNAVEDDIEWTSWGVGDTIGCGYDMTKSSIFFTRNGLFLGFAFTDVDRMPLSPVVGFTLEADGSCKCKMHFGETRPFLYSGPEIVLHPAALVCIFFFMTVIVFCNLIV